MPELPEVEIIKAGLQKKIIGLKIQKIQVLSPKTFLGNPNLVQGKIVLKIWRRAKLLGIDLADQSIAVRLPTTAKSDKRKTVDGRQLTLLFHLKMSGQLIYEDEKRFVGGHPTEDMLGKMPGAHTRVIFSFADGSHLYFNDQRRFGWVKIVQSAKCKVQSEEILGQLGPEPLKKGFAWQVLKQNLLKHPKLPVKVAIMDQSVVSGVGNIYANEACFAAKIDPRKKVFQLSDQEFKGLHRGIVKSLQAGIKYGGSTRVHFVDAEGHKGYFLDYANVYGKEGYLCNKCSGKVEKITQAGRGTYFCEHCQK